METVDVIVVGLGAMGSAAAYQLAARGKRVLGLEQYTAAHDRGSSHGGSRMIRLTLYREPDYVRLLQRAYELWRRLERDTGASVLTITGGLAVGRPDHSVVDGGARSARESGLPHEILEPADVRRRFPPFAPSADMVGVYEPTAGFLRPEVAIRTYLDHAARRGALLHFNEPALRWDALPSGDRVRVVTAAGVYEASRVIVTPGPWARSAFTKLDLPLAVARAVMFWFDPPGGIDPFLPDRFPVYVCLPEDGERFYGFPAHEGARGGAKVAFSLRLTPCTPDAIDRNVHESEIAVMREHLARCVPALNGPCIAARTCMYTNTPDLNFVIGPHPAAPQCIVAAGFSGHGFKFASVVGEILADLATDGTTRHSIGLFAPTRFSGAHSPTPRSAPAPYV
ncbi:MAG TPA: N-methyl-L-tryptophan oxidase [bacterium]|nr:N-methyl-L-tryptophan oxidase [bacterium]